MGSIGFNSLTEGLQLTLIIMIVAIIVCLFLLFKKYFIKEGFLNPMQSDPRRQVTMGGTGSLLTSVSGPVHHQDDYERYKDEISRERIPMGYTSPSAGFTRGASSSLRVVRDGGSSGPQNAQY